MQFLLRAHLHGCAFWNIPSVVEPFSQKQVNSANPSRASEEVEAVETAQSFATRTYTGLKPQGY
jgi:hypothetical protein